MQKNWHGNTILLLFILGWVLISLAIATVGWARTWDFLGINSMLPHFADLRTVKAALDAIHLGINPYLHNPTDPWGRPLNYPSIWINIFDILNLRSENSYLAFQYAMVFSFLLCCFLILKKYPSIYMLILLFSGSVLLGVERGNSDLFIFTLLYCAGIFSRKWGAFLMMGATMLKIYPILALPALHKDKRLMGFVLAFGVIFILYSKSELLHITNATPASFSLSYGAISLAAKIYSKTGFEFNPLLIAMSLLFFSCIISTSNWIKKLCTSARYHSASNLFLIGSCVYVGTFILGSNWDYRLIFLILTVPISIEKARKSYGYIYLIFVLISFNEPLLKLRLGHAAYAITTTAKIFIFILLSSVLIALTRKYLISLFLQR